jgi:2-polyprenyl-6-methoxyphenol hydroxylase-like FAD-dependent oxidoreductase
VLADLARAGVLNEVAEICYANEDSKWNWYKVDGTLLASMHWASVVDENEPNPRLFRPYSLQCGQHLLAEVLTKQCAKFPTTKILFGHELTGLEQDENGVKMNATKLDGEVVELEADWVVGADGGKSATRKLIGLTLDGFTWEKETFVAMNVHYPFNKYGFGPANFLIGGKKWAVIGRSGPEGNPWRVAYGIEPGMTDEWVWNNAPERLKEILPGPEPYEIVQAAQYRVHQRQVKNYKVGRVVLAGDAAHLNNPIGGFGLTTGMTDAGCIAEALGLVINGQKPESFLQAACDKRLGVFRDISNPGSQRFKRVVQEDPDTMPAEDITFFKRLREDPAFVQQSLLGTLALYTPVEDIPGY